MKDGRFITSSSQCLIRAISHSKFKLDLMCASRVADTLHSGQKSGRVSGRLAVGMKRWIAAFALILGWRLAVMAEPAPLMTLHSVAAMTNAEASQHQQVSFDATVTYYRPYARNMFVQDGNSAIYVHPTVIHNVIPGDRIRVRGTLHESFRPFIESADITFLSHGLLPKPQQPTFNQMINTETDCQLVKVHAVIQSADLVPNLQTPISTTEVNVLLDGGQATATIDSDDPARLKDLLDAEVELTGIQSGVFDNKMQETGILFHIQSLDQVKILKRAQVDPWSLPITPMDRALAGYRGQDLSSRERMRERSPTTSLGWPWCSRMAREASGLTPIVGTR